MRSDLVFRAVLAACGLLFSCAGSAAELPTARVGQFFRLRSTYSDHMVFQRNEPIILEGTSAAGVGVSVMMTDAAGNSVGRGFSRTGMDGVWRVALPPHEAGGPFRILVSPTGTCGRWYDGLNAELKDVMVGELWLASGQSNMEMPMWGGGEHYRLTNGLDYAKSANDKLLRLLKVPHLPMPDAPSDDVPADIVWKTADSEEAVKPFSSCAYLFGLELRKRLGDGVPVGIVDASWGGAKIEPWIPTSALEKFGMKPELEWRERDGKVDLTMPADPVNTCGLKFEDRMRILREWIEEARACTVNDSWHDVTGPSPALKEPALVVLEYPFELKGDEKNLRFQADSVNDTDEAAVDGAKIGATDIDVKRYWEQKRDYPIANAAAGKHVLRLEVFAHCGGGIAKPRLVWDGGSLDLDAVPHREKTLARPAADLGRRPTTPYDDGYWVKTMPRFARDYPSSMHNGMVAPFRNYRFRGMIWYQGCSNTGNAEETARYALQQKVLVEGLRDVFRKPDMLFIGVMLAAYEENHPWQPFPEDFWKAHGANEPSSTYTLIRESQKTIRELRGCELASAVDIGMPHDIHPKNKYEVARRLALHACNFCHGGTFAARGPELLKAVAEGEKLRLVFDPKSIPGGLVVKGAFHEHEFRIAGADGTWAFAAAVRDGDDVVLSSPEVKAPVKVRYAWDKCPVKISLFNRDGVAAMPFEATAGAPAKETWEGAWHGMTRCGDNNACWIGVENDVYGKPQASVLWRFGSPSPAKATEVRGNSLFVDMGWGTFTLRKNADGTLAVRNGKDDYTFFPEPPMCPAPDLSKIVWGEKVTLVSSETGRRGWKMIPGFNHEPDCWVAEDGVLTNRIKDENGKSRAPGANLVTVLDDFEDFRLDYEVNVPKGSNSGVYLRGRFEIQTIDSYSGDRLKTDCHDMGAYYGRATPVYAAERPAGVWQKVSVILYQRHITVWLNGVKVIDNRPVTGVTGGALDSDDLKPGPIYLQGDHSGASYRNMVLTRIVPAQGI